MSLELSLAALDVLWADLQLGRVPFPLRVRNHGDTRGDRARIRAAVYADLGRRGLACDERPADTLVEDLRLLADPTTTVDLVALLDMDDDKPVTALAATRGRHGILAVQGKLTLRLTRMRGTLTTGALVGLLPATRAAIGNSITQPAAALRADPGRHRRAQPGVVLRKVTPAVAADAKLRALAAVMDKPVRRAGQLGVTRTDDAGRRPRHRVVRHRRRPLRHHNDPRPRRRGLGDLVACGQHPASAPPRRTRGSRNRRWPRVALKTGAPLEVVHNSSGHPQGGWQRPKMSLCAGSVELGGPLGSCPQLGRSSTEWLVAAGNVGPRR